MLPNGRYDYHEVISPKIKPAGTSTLVDNMRITTHLDRRTNLWVCVIALRSFGIDSVHRVYDTTEDAARLAAYAAIPRLIEANRNVLS